MQLLEVNEIATGLKIESSGMFAFLTQLEVFNSNNNLCVKQIYLLIKINTIATELTKNKFLKHNL